MATGDLKYRRAARKAIEASGKKFTQENYNAYVKNNGSVPNSGNHGLTFGSTLNQIAGDADSVDNFGSNLANNIASGPSQDDSWVNNIGTPDAPKSGGRIKFDNGKGSLTSPIEPDQRMTNWSLSAPDKDALKSYSRLLSTTNRAVKGYTDKLNKSVKSYERAYNDIKGVVQAQGSQFDKAIMAMAQQGKEIDFNAPDLMKDLQEAVDNNESVDFESILEKYTSGSQTGSQVGGQDIGTPSDPKSGGAIQFDDTQIQQAQPQSTGAPKTYEEALNGLINASGKSNLTADEYKEMQDAAAAMTEGQPSAADRAAPPSQGAVDVNTNPDIEVPTSQLIDQAAVSIGQVSPQSLVTTLSDAGFNLNDLSSAEALQVLMTQQQIDLANDPTMDNFLQGQKLTIMNSYEDAIGTYKDDLIGLNAIIDGKDMVPTSAEQLSAKIYKQNTDFVMEDIAAEKDYQNKQYNLVMGQEREKRGRLEGYLKAKLYATKMQDSSAGLSSMAIQINAADMRLQMAENEHMRGIAKLNLESRRLMTDYANNITKIGMDIETKKDNALQVSTDKITAINKELISSGIEKRGLKAAAMSEFTDNMMKLDKEKKDRAQREAEFSYQKTQDLVDQAYKLSGLTGSVYGVNDKGEVYNTGVKTFKAIEAANDRSMDMMKYAHDVTQDSYRTAFDMIDMGGNPGDIEQLLNLKPGSLSGLNSKQMQASVKEVQSQREINSFINGDTYSTIGGALGASFTPGAYGGQCGSFMHQIYDIPMMGDSLQSKINTMTQPEAQPVAGNLVVFDEGTQYGHIASILETKMHKGVMSMRLLESNYPGGEKIRTDRWVPLDSPKIRGYGKQPLKPEFQAMVTTSQNSRLDEYVERARVSTIAKAKAELKDSIKGKSQEYQSAILTAFNDRINEKPTYNLNSGNSGLDAGYNLGFTNTLNYTDKSIRELEEEKKNKGDDFAGLETGATGTGGGFDTEIDDILDNMK